MSDNNFDIRARLTVVNELSPVLRRVLNDIQKFESVAKRVNNQLSGMGRTGTSALDSFNRAAKAATDRMRGMTNLARSAARDYAAHWNRANAQRLNDARTTYQALERLEVGYQRQLARRAVESRAGAIDRGRSAGRGPILRGTSPTTAIIAGGLSFSAAASAFKRRMEVNVAETKAQLFGGMSAAEVKKLRGDWSDQVAIKFGESASVVIDSFTESLKQGFGQDAAKRITDGAMESAAALEMNVADLMKLAGKTATSLYGNVKNADPARVVKMMNSVAIAAAATAADPNEIVEANKRALSALSTTKMRETDLSAFTSVGISAGLQPNKAGTALSYLTSEFANAGNARGQRAKDLNQAAQMLGYGSRQHMAQRMASAPTEFMLDMFTKMQTMSEQNRAKFANLAGMREWRDELVQMSKAADQIRETLKEIEQKSDSVSTFSATKLNSLQKRWDRIKTMFSLAWEKLGSGFEDTFVEISNWFDRHTSLFTSGRIAAKSREFVEKLKKAFGIGSIDEGLNKTVEKISSIDADRIIGFASGFVGGLVSVADSLTAMMKSAAAMMGRDGSNAEVLGKLSGQIVGLSVALGLLAPVLTVLAGFAGLISRIAGSIGGRALIGAGARFGLGPVFGPALGLTFGNEIGVADSAIRRRGETTTEWRERQRKLRELRNYKTPSDADPLFQPSSYTGSTDFSGRRRSKVDDLASQLSKFGGNVERAAFISSGPGGLYAALSTGGGAGRGLSGIGGGGGGIGGLPGLLRSTPGAALPAIGDGSSGAIIRRDKIPSFGGGGGSQANPGAVPFTGNDLSTGAGLSGNAFLAARRARFAEEIKNDPTLRMHLAAMQMTEGESKGGTIEALLNRMDMTGQTLRQGLGAGQDGLPNSKFQFYGPIKRHELPAAIRKLQANPKLFAKYDAYTQQALAGSHKIGGFTDQGLPTDPNGTVTRARRGQAPLPTMKLGGNEFTEWAGGGEKRSRAYREMIEKGIAGTRDSPIGNVPSPSQVIQNVPPPRSIAPNGDAGLGGSGGSCGNVAIHINGNSHDPEALASLVQRRIDESMNWRTHDTASEYT
ncbi:TP901 family phage tail tape measure protein [Bradyrhizobium sp. S3.9.2]|uniref:phage tail tape measure protein n=1 Tax=Bradyrhizobium sp. S3.9.2 TaxID=3156432 RepID=UPI00339A633B